MARCHLLACLAMLLSVEAQLRPRRVGVGALGEQAGAEAVASAADAVNPLDALSQMGGLDAASKAQPDNPMAALGEMMQNLAGAAGEGSADTQAMLEEMGKLASDPSLMQEKMQDVMKLMNSDDGAKIMEEVQSVLTDPDKMRQGLEQFATNPMLKNMADNIPGLKQVLDDPEVMEKSIAEAQSALREMGGLEGMQEKMQEVMSGLANFKDGDLESALREMGGLGEGTGLDGLGDVAKEMLANMNNGGQDNLPHSNLQDRVREQLAQMLRNRAGDDEAAAVEIDEF